MINIKNNIKILWTNGGFSLTGGVAGRSPEWPHAQHVPPARVVEVCEKVVSTLGQKQITAFGCCDAYFTCSFQHYYSTKTQV